MSCGDIRFNSYNNINKRRLSLLFDVEIYVVFFLISGEEENILINNIFFLLDQPEVIVKPEHQILSLDQFFEDFSSLIWLTYRKHFTQLANSNLTSDGGWGCMLRTGQMLLANAILIHMLKEGIKHF